jgi:site-specific recombinase XerD
VQFYISSLPYFISPFAKRPRIEGSAVSEDSLLERITAAAEERQLSQNTLTAYRRTWLKAIAWAAAEGLTLETLPSDRAGDFYEEAHRRPKRFASPPG